MTDTLYKIRPLNFVKNEEGWQARTPFGPYIIRKSEEGNKWEWRYSFRLYFDDETETCATKVKGVEAANAHWIKRISGALDPAEAELLGEPDWWYRDLDPDECGYSPHEALRYVPECCVALLRSSHRGPTKFAFRAPVIGDPDEDEVLLFDTEAEALAAAEERRAALKAHEGDA